MNVLEFSDITYELNLELLKWPINEKIENEYDGLKQHLRE